MNSKSSLQALASDIFRMIAAVREGGRDPDLGFENCPLETAGVRLRYLFYPKKSLLGVPGMPLAFKKRLGLANVLAVIEKNGKPLAFHLLAPLPFPLARLASEEQLLKHISAKGVADYEDHLKTVLREAMMRSDLPGASADEGE